MAMFEYKILAERDKFIGKFDPKKLETALNSLADEGWRFVGVATADVNALTGKKQEALFILERERR
jgi:hypothetical protein